MPSLVSQHDNTPEGRKALRKSSSSLANSPRQRQGGSTTRHRGPPPTNQRTSAPSNSSQQRHHGARNTYEYPKPRPSSLAQGSLWLGSEPDVDHTFFRWDGIGAVPNKPILNAVCRFEAGEHVSTMDPDTKTALVHVVSQAMLHERLSATKGTIAQIGYFLIETYRDIKDNNPHLVMPPRNHWILGTLRDRTPELEWLKYQAERRWWHVVGKKMEAFSRQLEEPPESEVNALFEAYTHHADLPPF
ncbi:hypothetical protein K439DRAFT_600729 [Ramaria rubella]|nr:hypothetical protein K439DRAFT_600729 [Ramaria rubella]